MIKKSNSNSVFVKCVDCSHYISRDCPKNGVVMNLEYKYFPKTYHYCVKFSNGKKHDEVTT